MAFEQKKAVQREILVGFWKVHILHHAASGPVVGQWMLTELRRHGYEVSPGTLYPMLHRLEKLGWLRSEVDPDKGSKARRSFYLTEQGREILGTVREYLGELRLEVGQSTKDSKSK